MSIGNPNDYGGGITNENLDDALDFGGDLAVYTPSEIGADISYFVSGYAEKVSTALIDQLGPIILTGVILYFTLNGWLVLAGRSQNTIGDLAIKSFKISLVAFFGLNSGNFIGFVLPAVQGIEQLLAQSLTDAPSAWMVLDKFYKNLTSAICDTGGKMLDHVIGDFSLFGDDGFLELFIIILVQTGAAILGYLTSLVVMLVLLACTIGLPIILGFGPLFICCLMFPITRQWFDGWLRSVIGLIMTMIVAVSLVNLLDHITANHIKAIQDFTVDTANIDSFVRILVGLSFALCAVLVIFFKISTLVSGLVGGVQLTGLNLAELIKDGSTVGSPVLKAYRKAKSMLSGKGNTKAGEQSNGSLGHKDNSASNLNRVKNSAANMATASSQSNNANLTSNAKTINTSTINSMQASNNSSYSGSNNSNNAKAAPSNVIDINARRAYGMNDKKTD